LSVNSGLAAMARRHRSAQSPGFWKTL
jgi:hypothetical protein